MIRNTSVPFLIFRDEILCKRMTKIIINVMIFDDIITGLANLKTLTLSCRKLGQRIYDFYLVYFHLFFKLIVNIFVCYSL